MSHAGESASGQFPAGLQISASAASVKVIIPLNPKLPNTVSALGRLQFLLSRHKSNLNPFIHCGSDSLEHRERVSLIVGIL